MSAISSEALIDKHAVVHPGATVGARTRVWQFSVVLSGAIVGEDCNLNAHTLVEGGAIIGNRVTLKCGVYVWNGVILEDDVFCGPNATFTNDKQPRSRVHPERYPTTRIKKGCVDRRWRGDSARPDDWRGRVDRSRGDRNQGCAR